MSKEKEPVEPTGLPEGVVPIAIGFIPGYGFGLICVDLREDEPATPGGPVCAACGKRRKDCQREHGGNA